MHARRLLPALAILGVLFASPLNGQDIVGRWMGALEVPGATLRLQVDVNQVEDGLETTITSIDQGNAEIPVQTTTVADGVVVLEVPQISARYEGTLSEDGTLMEGTWTQGGNAFPLNLERTEEG